MALAPFFDRVVAAAGTLLVSRESLEALLHGAAPSIVLDGDSRADCSSRWIAELAVNLLARLYPRLNLSGHPVDIARLRAIALAINPAIECVEALGDSMLRLNIGAGTLPGPGELHARADGWVATVSGGESTGPCGPPNPYASGAAACIAVSELTRRTFGRQQLKQGEARRVSLLDYSETTGADLVLEPVMLPEVAFIGLGAVGNGALWALGRHEDASGKVWLVDDETIELSNLQRSVLTTMADIDVAKSAIADRSLSATGLTREACNVDLSAFASQFGDGFRIPVLAVSVDNIEARRAVQALLPRLAINAYTGLGSLGVSWHRFNATAACLACLYHPTTAIPSQADLVGKAFGLDVIRAAFLLVTHAALSEEELRAAAKKLGAADTVLDSWRGRPLEELYVNVVCGGADIPIPGRGHSEIVPLAHQSALAGILFAAEIVKRSTPALEAISQRDTLVAWHDVLRLPPQRWVEPRLKMAGCFCGDHDYRSAFSEKWTG